MPRRICLEFSKIWLLGIRSTDYRRYIWGVFVVIYCNHCILLLYKEWFWWLRFHAFDDYDLSVLYAQIQFIYMVYLFLSVCIFCISCKLCSWECCGFTMAWGYIWVTGSVWSHNLVENLWKLTLQGIVDNLNIYDLCVVVVCARESGNSGAVYPGLGWWGHYRGQGAPPAEE